jgi:arylsulfatase A-like enzyme/Tfp pilus assembly protein PilF
MSKSTLVQALAAVCLFAAACGSPGGFEDEIEAVVVISIDTLRADAVSSYGAVTGSTPNIDQLAAEGTRFGACVSPAPLTFPSHATLLTGLHPLEHGVLINSLNALDPGIVTLAERLKQAGWSTGAVVASGILNRQYGLAQGFDEYRDNYFATSLTLDDDSLVAEADAAAATDQALAWMEEQRGDTPFFLFLHYIDPHSPYRTRAPYDQQFADSPYLAEVAYTDAQIGRVIEYLRSSDLARRTLVVVTADHGESLGAHGEATHGFFLYDTVIRVPLVMRGPRVPQGQVVESTVGLIDVTPTILALLDLPADPSLPGRALIGAPPADHPYVSVSYAPSLIHRWSPQWSLSRAAEKFILSPVREYYRKQEDPREQVNRFGLDADRDAELERELQQIAGAYLERHRKTARLSLDPEQERQLAALGYTAAPEVDDERPLDDFSGADTKNRLGIVELMRQFYVVRAALQFDRALEILDEVREQDPDTPVPDSMRSLILLLAGRNQELLDWMQDQPDSFLQQKEQRFRHAVALGRLKRHEEAISLLRENLRIDPAHRSSRFELAGFLASRADASEEERARALAEYDTLLEQDPFNKAARNNYANLLARTGNLVAASQEFETLLEHFPDYPTAYRNLGFIYAKMGASEQALDRLQRYLDLVPNAPNRARVETVITALREATADGAGATP